MPVLNLNITVREDGNLIQDASIVIMAVRPNWDAKTIQSKVFTEGKTNGLIGFFQKDNKEDIVMIKIYGQNTQEMIDRDVEIKTMKILHEVGCGPELYAIFQNGISYEFIQGRITSNEDVRSQRIYPLIAKELARIHCRVPLLDTNGAMSSKEAKIWEKLRKLNSLVVDILGQNDQLLQRLKKEVGFDLDLIQFGSKAINELEWNFKMQAPRMPITFCHNDLQLGNIIYNEKTDKVSFIDYEYAMNNYSCFDVANHFCEFSGIESISFANCPDKSFKSKWISEYLKCYNDNKDETQQLGQEEFETWVELCIPVSNLFWGLWAIIQAQNSSIQFDFAWYFGICFAEYNKRMTDVKRMSTDE